MLTLAFSGMHVHHSSLFGRCCDFLQTNFTNVSSQEMAPKKPPTKRSRKDVTGEGYSAAPQVDVEFDGHRFWSEEHQ